MTMLVTLDEAKDQVSILRSNTYFDDILELKVEIASDILLGFCKLDEPPDEWYDDSSPANLSAPGRIKGCVLLMAAEMFLNRESTISNPLSDTVKAILRLKDRGPTLA